MKRLSLPHEHGGALTAAGAAVTAALLAPAVAPAVGAGAAFVAAFFARGPVDRIAGGAPLAAWDRPMLVLIGAIAGGGALLAASGRPWVGIAILLLCVGAVLASATARRMRKHRHAAVELGGMAALGASSGFAAYAAGVPALVAATAAVVLAVHSGVAVPLVRTEIRRRERSRGGRALWVASAALVAGALAVTALGHPLAAAALIPRALTVLERAVVRREPLSANRIGVRETAALAACVALIAVAL